MRNQRLFGIAILLAMVTACTDGPTSPTGHTYYCRNLAGTVEYLVPPGHGPCDKGDITVWVK